MGPVTQVRWWLRQGWTSFYHLVSYPIPDYVAKWLHLYIRNSGEKNFKRYQTTKQQHLFCLKILTLMPLLL